MTVTKTIGSGTGRDYSTLSAWAASIPATLADSYVGECYNDSEFTNTDTVLSLTGHTTTSTFTITLTAATGQSFVDNANVQTNALTYNQANGVGINGSSAYNAALDIHDNYVTLSRLQIKNPLTGTYPTTLKLNGNETVSQCIIDGASSAQIIDAFGYSGTNNLVTNTLIIHRANAGKSYWCNGGNVLANVTLACPSDFTSSNTAIAIDSNYGAFTGTNLAIFGYKTVAAGTSSTRTFTTCMSSATTVPTGVTGSEVFANQFVNVTSSGSDFRLKSGANCIDAGTTDTTDIPSAIDIVGTARPQGSKWDIGCWEYVQAIAPINVSTTLNEKSDYSTSWQYFDVSATLSDKFELDATSEIATIIDVSTALNATPGYSTSISIAPITTITTFSVTNYESSGNNSDAAFDFFGGWSSSILLSYNLNPSYQLDTNLALSETANRSLDGLFTVSNDLTATSGLASETYSVLATLASTSQYTPTIQVAHQGLPSFTVSSSNGTSTVKITPCEGAFDFDLDLAASQIKKISAISTIQAQSDVSDSITSILLPASSTLQSDTALDDSATLSLSKTASLSSTSDLNTNTTNNPSLSVSILLQANESYNTIAISNAAPNASFGSDLSISYVTLKASNVSGELQADALISPVPTITTSLSSEFQSTGSVGDTWQEYEIHQSFYYFNADYSQQVTLEKARSQSFDASLNVNQLIAQVHPLEHIEIQSSSDLDGAIVTHPYPNSTLLSESDTATGNITNLSINPVFATQIDTTNTTVWTRSVQTLMRVSNFVTHLTAKFFFESVSLAASHTVSTIYSKFFGPKLYGVQVVNEAAAAPDIASETVNSPTISNEVIE